MNTGLVHVAKGDYEAAIRDFEQAIAPLATARTPAYAHPFYWAGFVAIGDPR